MSSAELKPCPFCGCPAHKIGGGYSRSGAVPHAVKCVNVLCAIEIRAMTKEDAECKWNTRSEK